MNQSLINLREYNKSIQGPKEIQAFSNEIRQVNPYCIGYKLQNTFPLNGKLVISKDSITKELVYSSSPVKNPIICLLKTYRTAPDLKSLLPSYYITVESEDLPIYSTKIDLWKYEDNTYNPQFPFYSFQPSTKQSNLPTFINEILSEGLSVGIINESTTNILFKNKMEHMKYREEKRKTNKVPQAGLFDDIQTY